MVTKKTALIIVSAILALISGGAVYTINMFNTTINQSVINEGDTITEGLTVKELIEVGELILEKRNNP